MMLTALDWEVFDEFVLRIGREDEWEFAVLRQLSSYHALCDAGLLTQRVGVLLIEYGLTASGRREVCSRGGHEFETSRPGADGCQMCDAVVCPDCCGFGRLPKDSAEAHGEGGISGPDCTCCESTGLVERG